MKRWYQSIIRGEQFADSITLEIDGERFRLETALSGTFGSFIETYRGTIARREDTLEARSELLRSRKWTIHDEDPIEDEGPCSDVFLFTVKGPDLLHKDRVLTVLEGENSPFSP